MYKYKCIFSLILCMIAVLSFQAICSASPVNGDILSNNLVQNGSFEEELTGWKNWTGNYEATDDVSYDGGYSVKIWANNAGDNEQLLQNVKVVPGKTYRFSMQVRVPSGQSIKTSLLLSGTGYAQKTISTLWATYSEQERDYSFTPNKVNGDTGDGHTIWKEVTATVTIPSIEEFSNYDAENKDTYPNLCIYIQYTSGGNWNRYTYIDNVILERVYDQNEIAHLCSFTQNGEDITEMGFTSGNVIANIKIDDVKINGHVPFIIVAVYNGEEMLTYSYGTNYSYTNEDGTITLSASVEVTDDMLIHQGCSIAAFIWSDMSTMVSLSETFSIGQL